MFHFCVLVAMMIFCHQKPECETSVTKWDRVKFNFYLAMEIAKSGLWKLVIIYNRNFQTLNSILHKSTPS